MLCLSIHTNNSKRRGVGGAQLRRCSTSVSTICVALLFTVIRDGGMSRNYLDTVPSIVFKWKTSVHQWCV